MKRHPKQNDELLYRFLGRYGSPREEEMETALDAVWRDLQHSGPRQAKGAPNSRPDGAMSFFDLRRRALAAFAIAIPVVAVVLAVVIGWDIFPKTSSPLRSGLIRVSMEQIETGHVFDSGGQTGATLVLPDNSRVEMHSGTGLFFERAQDGLRIRLNRGSILVSAAKQRNGHLYVQTRDVAVSVVGTVFLVNAEPQGSRVAVVEGEVHVQRGETTERLLPGERLATSTLLPSHSVIEEIAWTRQAGEHYAMLQQSAVPPIPAVAELPDRFEVASIRPSELPTGQGARGGGGGGLSASMPPPCLSANAYAIAGLQLQLNPGRLVLKYLPLHTLVALAYGHECPAPDTLTGGPDWVRADIYDLEAVIPAGTPAYTKDQFLSGNAPRLQRMLQNLLADRFKLAMKREVKEMQVYNLVVAQEGKLKSSADQTPDQAPPAPVRGGLLRGGPPVPAIPVGTAPISRLATNIQLMMRRPVIDKTSLTGLYDMWLEFPEVPMPMPPADGTPPSDIQGRLEETQSRIRALLPSKLESTLGLRLEPAKAPVEVLVIVSAEKPSAN